MVVDPAGRVFVDWPNPKRFPRLPASPAMSASPLLRLVLHGFPWSHFGQQWHLFTTP